MIMINQIRSDQIIEEIYIRYIYKYISDIYIYIYIYIYISDHRGNIDQLSYFTDERNGSRKLSLTMQLTVEQKQWRELTVGTG